jgi:hypothetical protein
MPLQCNAPPAHGGEDAVSTCDLDPMLSWFIEHGCEAFEVLADTGLLDVALRTSGHFAPQNHLGLSQSNDVTRIFPPSSRFSVNVALSVVPNFSSTFSTFSTPYLAIWCW